MIRMKRKIAVLSNVNMDFVKRMLQRDFEVLAAEGYGNELGQMMDGESSYQLFEPEVTVLLMDLMELMEHDLKNGEDRIGAWFRTVRGCIREGREYFISDACLWGPELAVIHEGYQKKRRLEAAWQDGLEELCRQFPNVHIFPYCAVVSQLGEENAFSLKMWYMGRILHTNEVQKRLAAEISRRVYLASGLTYPGGERPRKVLLLDLDNTLWGGLAGEADHKPVLLSEDHAGLAYKNLQRVILGMQEQGVLLGIVSKNNEADALEILEHHPHCVLRPEKFAACKINWEPKHENIRAIAKELNLGLDSFVFWDDNPAERELVKTMLPEVAVPDFPTRPEELSAAMTEIYRSYFQRLTVTDEDLEKTAQYQANAKRNALEAAVDFDTYLQQLQMVITREDPARNLERFLQLVNKTNQFNLTTRRYELTGLQEILADAGKRVFLYRVEDCFGDNGIVAAAIVDLGGRTGNGRKPDDGGRPENGRESDDGRRPEDRTISGAEKEERTGGLPRIEEFVMSCRVMGRRIEYALIEDMEESLKKEGFTSLHAQFIPTAKNKPVEQLYEKLGYRVCFRKENGEKEYEIDLASRPQRVYYSKIKQ